ncbi:hypothetical protein DNH61_15355 [Paenibacillus sambharensis]|uniref:Uncharacterized protein n=1 Tax=Paenibacillus sambharensis TaxID=1803190 RepID=A0A2W1LKH6_9BACL|nr:hypothetical protein [Paenibacillus sambharensis]PZD95014.1 hypothetical protein DNH61_15355 [Paenibacillus sambharensis]
MKEETRRPAASLFSADGKPLRVLSTSLGIALLANTMLVPGGAVQASSAEGDSPKLVEWSTEEVKAFYDPQVDWSLPLPANESTEIIEEDGQGASGSGGTTIIHSGFGWGDLMLYHLLFNRGAAYSSTSWHNDKRSYRAGSGAPYKPKMYTSGTFQNKPVTGSAVPPKTSNSAGKITRRSTSSSPGGIGGSSSSMSSSGSSSSSKSSSSSSSRSSGFGG